MANNVFDQQFKNRLLAFQSDHGLPLDGTLGPKEWAKLTEVTASDPEPAAGEPEPTAGEPEVTTSESEPTAAEPAHQPGGGAPAVNVEDEYPLLFKFATLCVTEAGVVQFIREELGVDLDEINATIEEVLA